jgi:DNA-binding transcriptional MerR regulator
VDQHRHYSAGGVARELGISVSLLDKLERAGAIPRVPRLEGSGRKLFTEGDVAAIRAVVAQRRAKRGEPAPTAA